MQKLSKIKLTTLLWLVVFFFENCEKMAHQNIASNIVNVDSRSVSAFGKPDPSECESISPVRRTSLLLNTATNNKCTEVGAGATAEASKLLAPWSSNKPQHSRNTSQQGILKTGFATEGATVGVVANKNENSKLLQQQVCQIEVKPCGTGTIKR